MTRDESVKLLTEKLEQDHEAAKARIGEVESSLQMAAQASQSNPNMNFGLASARKSWD